MKTDIKVVTEISLCWRLPDGKWKVLDGLTSYEMCQMKKKLRKDQVHYRSKVGHMVYESVYKEGECSEVVVDIKK